MVFLPPDNPMKIEKRLKRRRTALVLKNVDKWINEKPRCMTKPTVITAGPFLPDYQ